MLLKRVYDYSLKGVSCSPGVAWGQAYFINNEICHKDTRLSIPPKTAFLNALHRTHTYFQTLTDFELSEAYSAIAQSPSLKAQVLEHITLGLSAQAALEAVIQDYQHQIQTLDNTYLSARSVDIVEVGKCILKQLNCEKKLSPSKWPEALILITQELSLLEFIQIPKNVLKGIVCNMSHPLSHAMIFAKEMGIPILSNLDLKAYAFEKLLIDGLTGEVYLEPSVERLHAYETSLNAAKKTIILPETPILELNMHGLSNLKALTYLNAKGIGLYRTEIDFMRYSAFPSYEQQYAIYKKVLASAFPKKVNIRVLDIACDKTLPYFKPSIDKRGLKLMLAYPEILNIQLEAMLTANHDYNNLAILLPMVESMEDLNRVTAMIQGIEHKLQTHKVPVGAMIENRWALENIECIIEQVDFVSIGSNDLACSLLSSNSNLSRETISVQTDSHPKLLKAIHHIVSVAHSHHKKVGMCGQVASNPAMLATLVELKVDSLSVDIGAFLTMESQLSICLERSL